MEARFRRRHLPHWDISGATYFVTACLAGSIPAQGLLDIDRYRMGLARSPRPRDVEESDWQVRHAKLVFARVDDWLDARPAVRHFANADLAREVQDAMLYFAGSRYELFAWVVMPSHVHWVFKPLEAWVQGLGPEADVRAPRERIMHSLKRYIARQCNQTLGREGAFWQDESYDHCVRDADEFQRIIEYIELNPVRAALVTSPEQWTFSSAYYRAQFKLNWGEPITRRTGL
jgi:type I restriction enzyme R subunit